MNDQKNDLTELYERITNLEDKLEGLSALLPHAYSFRATLTQKVVEHLKRYRTDFFGLRFLIKHNPRHKDMEALLKVYEILNFAQGAFISICASFEGVPKLPHGILGMFISKFARIGSDCIIFQHVTIGSDSLGKKPSAPRIGNNVFIGAGARLIGNISIGDHCRIGAGCVVTKSVPANCVVVMEQPRVIQHNEDLINYFKPV